VTVLGEGAARDYFAVRLDGDRKNVEIESGAVSAGLKVLSTPPN
jgi:hypothetical protein